MTKKLYVDQCNHHTVLREQYFYLMRRAVRLGSRFPKIIEDIDPDDQKVEKLLLEFNSVTTELDQITELINGLHGNLTN
jgi:hypothetical protein